MRRMLMFAVLLGTLVGLAGCSWLIQPPGEEEPAPPPDNPAPEPEPMLGILMEGEPLPDYWWPPLEYGHFYEGQYITFSLVTENIEVELVEWWVWPNDHPDWKDEWHHEGISFREYFVGWPCYTGKTGPRQYTVLCRVTDRAGKLYELNDTFWIHTLSG